MAKLDEKKTLRYIAAFVLSQKGEGDLFRVGKTAYRHISTVYDTVSKDYNVTLLIVLNMNTLKYETLNMSDDKVGRKIVEFM